MRQSLLLCSAVILGTLALALVQPVPSLAKKKSSLSRVCDAASSTHLCYAFTGKKNAEKKTAQGNELACKFMQGRYLASATCPAAKAIGRCTIARGTAEEYTLTYYSGGKISKKNAEKDCKDPKSGLHRHGAGHWKAL